MGFIEKRGPRRYRARCRLPSGKERSRTFERRADAERWLALTEADLLRGMWRDPRLDACRSRRGPKSTSRGLCTSDPQHWHVTKAVYRKHLLPGVR